MNDRTIIRDEYSEEGPLPPGILIQLSFVAGPQQGQSEKLFKTRTVLGRSKGDIILKDTAASGQHAEIVFEGGRFIIRDLSSTNGTFLNGGQVWDSYLNNDDEITIGNSVIRVTLKQMAKSASWADLGMDESSPQAQSEDDNEVTNINAEWEAEDPLAKPLPPGAKAGLQVISGLDSGHKLLVKKRATLIGRAGADLILHDLDVSRKHACIEFMSPQRVIIKDLRSRNGTFLNDRWTSIANIANGDIIRVGNTQIKVFLQLPE